MNETGRISIGPARGAGEPSRFAQSAMNHMVAGLGVIGLILVTAATPTSSGQGLPANATAVRIVSPAPESYVTGPTVLRARVDPADSVSSVIFFVDGRQACVLTKRPFECEWDPGASVREHQVRLVVNLTTGGRIVQTVRTKALDYAEKVEVDVVQVTVTVTDDRGRFIRALPQTAFHVAEDERPQTISHFTAEDVPLELIVAVDISGSMATAMPKLKTAVKEFLATVPSQHRVTLMAFNDTVFAVGRRGSDPAERAKAVDRLASWGGTALYDVILRGVDMLGGQTGRKAIIVFSDGEDEGSHAAMADVERRLEASDVTLYMIGQGRGVTMDPLKKVMQRLVAPTGGRALFTEHIDELRVAFTDLLDELSNQ